MLLNAAQLLVLFSVLLIYHLRCLRWDSEQAAQLLEARQNAFPVLVIDSGNESYLKSITKALRKHAPGIPLVVLPAGKKFSKDASSAKAAILPATLALEPPVELRRWLRTFRGDKIVVSQAASGWVMNPLSSEQAALSVRQIAEGGTIRISRPSAVWEIVKVVAVVWLGIQLFIILLVIGISLLAG